MSNSFYSKVLLFGEYSVIKDSMGLAMPYRMFQGKLSFVEGVKDRELVAFSKHMESVDIDFDLTSFKFDIGQGIFFDSSIPRGFGLGSSGALCAALYDRYVENKSDDLNQLRKIFSEMESHFHGSSSGVDPLISYLNQPILIKGNRDLGPVELPKYNSGNGALFLLNTGRPRRTEPLVNLFLEKCKNSDFDNLCLSELTPITNKSIESFIEGDIGTLLESFNKLSSFQFDHFTPMIPKLFLDLWKDGLESGSYSLKLCGAGGGGFLLGVCADFDKVKDELKDYELKKLLSF